MKKSAGLIFSGLSFPKLINPPPYFRRLMVLYGNLPLAFLWLEFPERRPGGLVLEGANRKFCAWKGLNQRIFTACWALTIPMRKAYPQNFWLPRRTKSPRWGLWEFNLFLPYSIIFDIAFCWFECLQYNIKKSEAKRVFYKQDHRFLAVIIYIFKVLC